MVEGYKEKTGRELRAKLMQIKMGMGMRMGMKSGKIKKRNENVLS